MIDKQMLMQFAEQNPQISQAVDVIEARLSNMPGVTPEIINQMVHTLEFVLQNPDQYPQVREAAIRSGFASEQDLPQEFDPVLVVSLLLAFYEMQAREASGRYARGGLARAASQLAAEGRGGDTILAHINPMEASVLSRLGGGGTVNPTTGLVEFKGGVGKILAKVAPVVISFIAPEILPFIGGSLTGGALTGAAASALGGAAVGGIGSKLAGGDFAQGAIGGALGAGGGSALGGALAPSLSSTAQNVLGSSLAGAAGGALSGQGATTGALQGAIGGYTGSTLANAAGNVGGQMGAGLQTAGTQFGNALAMGATPQQALAAGTLSGLAAGFMGKPAPAQKSLYDIAPPEYGSLGLKSPADIAVDGLKSRAPGLNLDSVSSMGFDNYGASAEPKFKGPDTLSVDYSLYAPSTQAPGAQPDMGTGIKTSPLNQMAAQATQATAPGVKKEETSVLKTASAMLPLLSLVSAAKTPTEVQQAVAQMTPEQQEYFSRPMKYWDWDQIDAAAKSEGVPIGIYIAQNWNKMGSGAYDQTAVAKARGGVMSRLATGGGTGRSDSISARLSDGEYVMDAETVSLLGDGSTSAGARRLDEMRAKIREHKGKSMARGKFSANAKSPLAYLKGAA